MQCNIDPKGKRLRLISGLCFCIAGVVLGVLAALSVLPGRGVWVGAVICVGLGGFQVFEGLVGWCAVRAMGFRTRI